MVKEFEGKVAIVTGTASPRGLGRAICNRIAEGGGTLIMVDLDQAACDAAAKEVADAYGVKAIGVAANVTNAEQCENVAKIAKDQFGRIDFLVNNAGLVRDTLLLRMSEDMWDLVVDVNLKGPFLMTKAASKLIMKAPSGRIVNISSIAGLVGSAGQANYASAKAGLIGFTKVTAREFASRGVLVNAVCPGYVKTELTDALPEAVQAELDKVKALAYHVTPKDIANAVRFFLSDDSKCVTGTALRVDSGAAIGM
ncbi:MAG: SDR family oxidoreductase [Leptospiraceae bacterium]|nr:SDR family oxidoreductase [Leptospiraceae bacterium]MCP5498815.1 SDR family oxidoreductase [Leptospiraceae bacterium]